MKRNNLMKVLLVTLCVALMLSIGCFAGDEAPTSFAYNTLWAALPPVIAIGLALITKEVYSSLFLGIFVGGLMYTNFQFMPTVIHVFDNGIIANPNCSTIIMLVAVAPLHRAKKLRRLVASTYQAASGAGAPGLAELEQQIQEYAAGKPLTVKAFQHQLTYNLIKLSLILHTLTKVLVEDSVDFVRIDVEFLNPN